jgi:hypothetical protein
LQQLTFSTFANVINKPHYPRLRVGFRLVAARPLIGQTLTLDASKSVFGALNIGNPKLSAIMQLRNRQII